ncbi:MAG: UdgX family uracil-DNA binding protein, partial [Sphingomonas sp.]
MHTVMLDADDDFDGWRAAVRWLVSNGVPPDQVSWRVGGAPSDLFDTGNAIAPAAAAPFPVPKAFVDLARKAVLHKDPERFTLLHTLLGRLRATPGLMSDQADPLVRRVEGLAQAVRRDIHKMRAFVRFREVEDHSGPRYVAWFEPEFHICRANAGFFVDRFASMRWSILTPKVSIHWDGHVLTESQGATKGDAPAEDPTEDIWKSYYAAIFNPARLKVGAMLKEMPRKYWKNMPETALVGQLIAGAQAREAGMVAAASAKPGDNSIAAWHALREEAASCTRCPLHHNATQTVFGEGPVDAALMVVGEQPGDQEDLVGRPFVGPAGQLFERALSDAGIDRGRTYVTNAVKHFKFEPRGKRRIHAKPHVSEVSACRWWIGQERALIRPKMTVLLGATAARSVLGRAITISKDRGRALQLPENGGTAWVTVHPSYLLRLPDEDAKALEYRRFVE